MKLPGSSIYGFEGIDAEATINKVESITLTTENGETSVAANRTLVINAAIAPAKATFPAIAWGSSNPEVATVEGGLVIPVKEGEVTITATATDGSGITASVTLTVTPKVVEPYATNFDKNTNATRTDRFIKNIIFEEEGTEAQTLAVGHKPYMDKTDQLLTCTAGSTVKVTFDKQANWMHGYVYIDLDGDKQFSFNDGNTDQSGTDVVSFSFYSGDFNNDASGVNSAGATLTGSARNTMECPAFVAPIEEGEYRIRFKMDWNGIDAGGQVAADGTCTGTNGILANGGVIVDATLQVNDGSDVNAVTADDAQSSTVYDLQR